MDIVSLKYLDFLNGQNQNVKRSYLVASFLISDIQKSVKSTKGALVKYQIYRIQKTFLNLFFRIIYQKKMIFLTACLTSKSSDIWRGQIACVF